MTNAMINKAKNAIEEAKERCSFAYEAGFKHYGKNYRMWKDTESGTWKVFRCSETDIHDTLVGESERIIKAQTQTERSGQSPH